jgi:TonB family protein
MARIQSRVWVATSLRLAVALSICFQGSVPRGLSAFAQEKPSQAGMPALAASLGAQLHGAGVKSVVIFDLRGPDDQSLPLGSWLADQISKTLANTGQGLQVINRVRLAAEMKTRNLGGEDTVQTPVLAQVSESVEADGYVTGSFGPFKDQIGVTLVVWRTSDVRQAKGYSLMLNGRVPLGPEEASHLTVPLESLRPSDGIFRAGHAGMTVAECDYCPPPQFSAAPVWKQKQGTILMAIVVSPEGRPAQIKVTTSVDHELDAQAVKAVASYKFRPAVDPDGEPAAVHMPFAVIFRATNK